MKSVWSVHAFAVGGNILPKGIRTGGRIARRRPRLGHSQSSVAARPPSSWPPAISVTELAPHGSAREVDISGLANFAALIHVDVHHLKDVDLDAPILVAPVPELGRLVIDGWHRVHRALRDGHTVLPARILSQADEKHCRIRPAGSTGR